MVQIPTRENLGQARVNGRATPAQINPNVAYDIGRAGAAMDRAMSEVAAAFSGLGAKAQAQEDATWLANAKIKTLEADDTHRHNTEMNAGEDGTGFEQAPAGLKSSVEEIKKLPGGSPEARSNFDLWSAEQVYKTGAWAANSAQKRLRDSTLSKLDTRLTTLQSLAGANPERAEEYISAYEEELGGYVGSAITAQDAQERKRQARSSIGYEATAAKAIKKPGDLGKAMKALESYSRPDTVDTETRGLGRQGQETGAASGVSNGTLSFLRKEEGFTHKAKWDYAQHSNGYGTKAKSPGERISRQEAEARLRDETQKVSDFIDKTIKVPLTTQQRTALISFGFNLGTDDIEKLAPDINAGNFDRAADRMLSFNKAGGEKNAGLVARRQREANMLRNTQGAEPAIAPAKEPSVDLSKLPKVDGSIQPAEIAALEPADRKRLIAGMVPSLQVEMQDRMEKAVASLFSKGTQSIITPEEIDDSAPIIGAKAAEKWKQQLAQTKLFYDTKAEAKSMTREERVARLNDMVPTGNVEDLAAEERQKFDIWAGTIQQIDKALKEDPLRYVSSESESGRQALKAIASADPGQDGLPAREKAYTTLIELQKREGVAGSNIRLLSPEQAVGMVQRFHEAKTGPAKAQMVEGLKQQFGAHMGRVWGQLVQEGMQNSFLSMGTATERGQDALVQAYAVEKTLNEGAGKDEGQKGLLRKKAAVDKDFDTAVSSALTEFNSGIPFAHERLRQGYREAVEMVAMYYMVNQGKDQSSAIAQAYKDIVGDKVETFKGVNIPRDISNFYGSDLKIGLIRNYKTLIERDEPNIASNIAVRPDRNFADERRSYLDYVIGNGKFMTNEEGTGVWLLDSSGRKVQKFIDRHKNDRTEDLFYTWEDLAKAKEVARGNPLFGGRLFSDPFRE